MVRNRWATAAIRALLAIGLLVGGAILFVFARSEWLLRRTRTEPLAPFVSLPAHADSSEGRRLAVLVGCLQGCHGPAGEGGREEAEGIFVATAPALSSALSDYSDSELARLVRFGVKRDGKSAVGMPSGTFAPLSEEDLALIFAHLRTLPEQAPAPRERRIELVGRIALALGEWRLSADAVDPSIPRWGELPRTTPFERGRYLASVTCSECHGLDFRGVEYLASPALSIVSAYSLAQFERLLRAGEHLSGRKDGMMSDVARKAFVELTDREIADLHAYFLARKDELTPAAE